MVSINISINNTVFSAKLYDNPTTREMIAQMPFTLEMNDYAAQEKVKELPFTLPPAATQVPPTIQEGDLYIWSGNQLVLFYTTFSNSYSYAPVGYIENPDGLIGALGRGSVTVMFSIQQYEKIRGCLIKALCPAIFSCRDCTRC